MAINYATRTCDTLVDDLQYMQGVPDTCSRMRVLGYHQANGGGGRTFKWDATSTAYGNGGSIIQPIIDGFAIAVGRWVAEEDGPVKVKQWGLKGDGDPSDSEALQRIIDYYGYAAPGRKGAAILLTSGTYCLKNITIPSGIKIYAEQDAKNIFVSSCPVRIITTNAAQYVFNFNDDAENSSLQNLYIECDWMANPNLTAAIRFAGHTTQLIGNNVNNCAQHAVISLAGNCQIRRNSFFGWYGPPPTFTGPTDFKGVLHVLAMGDSYVTDNEVGAGLPYFDEYENPQDMLRDPIYRRIAPLVGVGFMGTSWFQNNLWENGDRGVIISQSFYNNFVCERTELSGGGGWYIVGQVSFTNISHCQWADNSLAGDGLYDDIEIEVGAAGYITFTSPTFQRIEDPDRIPTSTFRTRWNITNKGSIEINLVAPNCDPEYALKGLLNNEDVGSLPVRQVKGQYDPDNPVYLSVTTKNITPTGTPLAAVRMFAGFSAESTLSGGLEFTEADGSSRAIIGFAPSPHIGFKLNKPGGIWSFQEGPVVSSHTTESVYVGVHALNSSKSASLELTVGPAAMEKKFIATLDGVGNTWLLASNDIKVGITGGGNWKFLLNGQNEIPEVPLPVDDTYNYDILTRDKTSGGVKIGQIKDFKKPVFDVVSQVEITNAYMNANYSNVPYGVTLCFVQINDAGDNIFEVYRIGLTEWAGSLTTSKLP